MNTQTLLPNTKLSPLPRGSGATYPATTRAPSPDEERRRMLLAVDPEQEFGDIMAEGLT